MSNNEEYRVKYIEKLNKNKVDLGTKIIAEKIINNSIELSENDLKELIYIEDKFDIVYNRHERRDYSSHELINETLEKIQNNLNNKELTDNAKKILKYREADFYYYDGYCLHKESREQNIETRAQELNRSAANSFTTAIEKYKDSITDIFNVTIPIFNLEWNYKNAFYRDNLYKKSDLLAYMCNAIGDAYSKITEANSRLGNKERESESLNKSIFYCAYARHLAVNKKEKYIRNLGVALERNLKAKNYMVNEENFKPIRNLYQEAMDIVRGNNENNYNVFYTWLQLYCRFFDNQFSYQTEILEDIKSLNDGSTLEYLNERIDDWLSYTERAEKYVEIAIQNWKDDLIFLKHKAFICRDFIILYYLKKDKDKNNNYVEKFKDVVKVLREKVKDLDDYMKKINQASNSLQVWML